MVHPGGLLGCALPYGSLLKQRYSPWCSRLSRRTRNNSLSAISEKMVHPGGFEPPTARFVAEYSIQLSYGCIGICFCTTRYSVLLHKQHKVKDGASGRITRLRLALRVVAKATLSSLVLAIISQSMKQQSGCYLGEYGASGRIRTSDRSVRSRVLYPAELRMHRDLLLYYSILSIAS